jgi:aspartate ammonia-lyase
VTMLYGTQTQLSLATFGGRRLGDLPVFVHAYAQVKQAAAIANNALGVLDEPRATAIINACKEITAGHHADQFPSALVVGGGGTTTNMNVNEVIATRATQLAGRPVHPNDHVNASQSSNDTYPTAMALAVLTSATVPTDALTTLSETLRAKAEEHADTVYLGRTCLRDAVTVTAADTLTAQARAVDRGADELHSAVHALRAVPLGATVLGTGIGAPPGFTPRAITELATLTGHELTPAQNPFDALANLDPYAAVADAATRAATTLTRIAADVRLRSSGPHGGLGEVTIPALQAGSSIMPAKVNPVVPEYAMQLGYRIRGAAHTVTYAVAAGELELNVMAPVILDALANIFDDLDNAATTLATRCINGLHWDGPHREENLRHALDRRVELAAHQGYDTATKAADH